MRMRCMAAIAFMALGFGTTRAQQSAPIAEPTVELRVRSVNDLLDKAEFVGSLAGKEDIVRAAKFFLLSLNREKTGLAGINPKLPFGLYGNLSPGVVDSPVILMIPIADEERFLKLLHEQADLTTEKAEEGTLKAFVPVVEALYLRFANGYLYVGRSVKDLDPKTLIKPEAFFKVDDGSTASLLVRLERLPKEVKEFIFGQLELTVKEQRRQNGAKEEPAEKLFLDFIGHALTDGSRTFFDDARELRVRVFLDEKAKELSAEATLTAKPGSVLARNIASLAAQPSTPAAITAVKSPVLRASAKAGLPAEIKKRFAAMMDQIADEVEKKADPTAKATVRQALDALLPTVKAGEADASFSLSGPDDKGHHTLLVAVGVKKGKEIEKLLKELSLSAGTVADFDFDVQKIGAFSLHKIKLLAAPPNLTEIFGAQTFWVAISDDCFALSIEPDGNAIKAGLEAKKAMTPAFSVEVSTGRLVPVVARDLKPDEVKALLHDAFGPKGPEGQDKFSLSIAGGDQLTVKATIHGKAVRLFAQLGEMRKK